MASGTWAWMNVLIVLTGPDDFLKLCVCQFVRVANTRHVPVPARCRQDAALRPLLSLCSRSCCLADEMPRKMNSCAMMRDGYRAVLSQEWGQSGRITGTCVCFCVSPPVSLLPHARSAVARRRKISDEEARLGVARPNANTGTFSRSRWTCSAETVQNAAVRFF